MFIPKFQKSVSVVDVQTAATAPEPARTAPAPAAVIVRPKPAEPAPRSIMPAAVVNVEPVRIESVETVRPLQLETRRGDFVHNSQTMGTAEGFSHVSQNWLKRGNVMTFEECAERIERERGRMRDIVLPYNELKPVADEDGFGLVNRRTGERFSLSDSALDQFAERAAIGRTLPRRLTAGDSVDRETLAIVAANGLRRLEEKTCLIRTRSADNSIRAFLSEEYAPIDHTWFLDVLRSIVPGGLVSHFQTPDGHDSIFFNLLIPDSLRAESDSEYGGMLACGNGETGRSRLRSLPSIFRAICQNGCIWDRVDGISYIMQVHRGEINLAQLAAEIRDNLNRQIPLLGTGIDEMMKTRSIGVSGVDVIPVIGSVLQTLSVPGITREQSAAIVAGYENQRTESSKVTAFDVIQGITFAAQGFDAFAKETAERAAGSAMLWAPEKWETVFRAARMINSKQLARLFAKSLVS